ncbi:hypothetical protein [Arthrobacter bussei]|uniref:Uncharacterized protein n=1 Tax=Arthrobacter bussei TaxID=2594179 RepID=A0A7X1NQ51_9MICC|nr:hypothetical protein [Arthrobacter bussei]MPY10878.1 hypothetical protein [Arthrobacter bussei]
MDHVASQSGSDPPVNASRSEIVCRATSVPTNFWPYRGGRHESPDYDQNDDGYTYPHDQKRTVDRHRIGVDLNGVHELIKT